MSANPYDDITLHSVTRDDLAPTAITEAEASAMGYRHWPHRLEGLDDYWVVALSPDGQQALLMKDHDTTAMVYLASVEDAAPRAEQLFAAPAPMDTINHVVWSPDGQQVVMALADYSSMDEETYEVDGALAIVSADGATSRVIELPEALDPEIQITWSPDGRYVAFVDYWHPENEDALDNSTFEYPGVISIVELAHDTLQPVVTVDSPSVDGVNAISFDWSPDSRSLVYISTEGTLETHLFRIDIDGSNRQQLTPEGAGFGVIFDIAWAPLPQQP